jgi:probable DNA repair protein
LQRAHGVPHSSAERELEFARRLTGQLLQGAPEGVVSCAAQDGEQTLRPSLLVAALPERPPRELRLAFLDSLHRGIFESRRLERVVDPGPPPVPQGRHSLGGSSIFKLQSACAFRAFASLRLHARPLDGVEAGLDARQRGQLLHRVLEGFWRRARSSRALHDWPEELREEALSEAIEEALQQGKRERPDVLSGAFLGLERQRLTNLARQWLAIEAERPPFTVRDTERKVELEFGGVKLRAIIDRVDSLPDGRLVLIDYKTGPVRYADWLGDRPVEPQLPLYCVASREPMAALVYGRLRTGDMAFNGISEQHDMLPGVDPSEQAGNLGMTWQDRQQQWRDVLTELAAAFHRGQASVDPLQRRKTCRNCRLETFCRVEELEARR